jgi:hypothetical protein
MTRRELLLSSFDEHIILLRILARRFIGTDRVEDLIPMLSPDWQTVQTWYDSLWLFELQGIKACKYPGILENGTTADYATPKQFGRIAASIMFLSANRMRTQWHVTWRDMPPATIEGDPRYVAFRTMHDWIILCARVLAERGDAFDDGEIADDEPDWEPGKRDDPFKRELPAEAGPDEVPIAISCGNPRYRLLGGRFRNDWDPDFVQPQWRDVKRPWAAIRHFHFEGSRLTEQLQYGALRDTHDPRIAQLELLTPEVFAAWQQWQHGVELENVGRDPRFVAHKCGFDSQMILHMAREVMRSGGI